MKFVGFTVAVIGTVMSLATTHATASSWPSKPITVVVPYGAGGSSDLVGRAIAEQLQTQLGVSVVVENKPGAGGTLAAASVATSGPDGYQLMLSNTAHSAAPNLFDKLSYDFNKGMTHVARFAVVPNIILLNKDSKIANMEQFVQYLKKENKNVNYGTPGIGTTNHLAVELLNSILGTDPEHIPYKGAGPVLVDLIGDRLDFTIQSTPIAAGHIKNGSVKPIAVTSAKRLDQFPDIPTVAESINHEYEIVTWYGIDGPSGLPAEVIKRINGAIQAALANPAFSQRLKAIGAETQFMGSKEYSDFVDAETQKWKSLNLKKS